MPRRYPVAFHLPQKSGVMVLAEALDFAGAVPQGFDLADERLIIATANRMWRNPTWKQAVRYPSP